MHVLSPSKNAVQFPTFPSTVRADTLQLLHHPGANLSELHLHALAVAAAALLNTFLVPSHTVRVRKTTERVRWQGGHSGRECNMARRARQQDEEDGRESEMAGRAR